MTIDNRYYDPLAPRLTPEADQSGSPYDSVSRQLTGSRSPQWDLAETQEVQIQQRIISQLLECALLEGWLKEDRYRLMSYDQLVTKSDDVTWQQLKTDKIKPPAYWHSAIASEDRLLLVTDWFEDWRLIIAVSPSFCLAYKPQAQVAPMLQYRQLSSSASCIVPITEAVRMLEVLLSLRFGGSIAADCLSAALAMISDQATTDCFDPPTPDSPQAAIADTQAGIIALCQSLQLSILAQRWSCHHQLTTNALSHLDWYQRYRHSEQWASLNDRPFHPLAKSKLGFSARDYRQYLAEFNQGIDLRWLAVDRRYLMSSAAVTNLDQQAPPRYLLTPDQQVKLRQELEDKQIANSHIAIPVHPWQYQHKIAKWYAKELACGVVVELEFMAGKAWATSSLRSLLIQDERQHSVKLPLGVSALNSKRYLPAVKLINGEKNQALLHAIQRQDPKLMDSLYVCDERFWWVFMPEHPNNKTAYNDWLFKEKPTHLGAMIRSLPSSLCDEDITLLTMASLGMSITDADGSSHHLFDEILRLSPQDQLGSSAQKSGEAALLLDDRTSQIMALFDSLCSVFFLVHLRCYRFGLMPELHGQNVVLVLKEREFTGVILRDHDSVRIYLPWLYSHGLSDPQYLSPIDFKNRLYQDTATDLLSYFQSLGILVNIRSIVESLSAHYSIAEAALWRSVRQNLRSAIDDIDFSDDQRQLLLTELLQQSHYPHKTLLQPLVDKEAMVHGSMPAGQSVTTNPLMSC